MTKRVKIGMAVAITLVILALAFTPRTPTADVERAAAGSPNTTTSTEGIHEGLLYGRITTDDGATYEGRLRWGGGEEALWANYFNGRKDDNPWIPYVPADRVPMDRRSIGLFGFRLGGWDRPSDLRRPFMARFGDIARIEARATTIRVGLKSGTVVVLDRFSADDLADGLRVWDEERGVVVNLEEWRIRTIELLPTPARRGDAPAPLHGTVRTSRGDFTGLIQWDREESVGSDVLPGYDDGVERRLRFDSIRAITRHSRESARVTLVDGREVVLSGTRKVGRNNRGMYVDDPRYGRVLISWDAFDRVDFSPGGNGPAYDDFPPGRPLTGSIITRSGHHFAGRLVYDLDESETTETLDAPAEGVDYTIPFALIASIVPPGHEPGDIQRARVTLHSGEELQLEPAGDLGGNNAGMLVFVEGGERSEYVPWNDIEQIVFDGPRATR